MFEYANLLIKIKEIHKKKTTYIPINPEIEDICLGEVIRNINPSFSVIEIVHNNNKRTPIVFGMEYIYNPLADKPMNNKTWFIVLNQLIESIIQEYWNKDYPRDDVTEEEINENAVEAKEILYFTLGEITYNYICEEIDKDYKKATVYNILEELGINESLTNEEVKKRVRK